MQDTKELAIGMENLGNFSVAYVKLDSIFNLESSLDPFKVKMGRDRDLGCQKSSYVAFHKANHLPLQIR